jgi:hypothetical protein
MGGKTFSTSMSSTIPQYPVEEMNAITQEAMSMRVSLMYQPSMQPPKKVKTRPLPLSTA